MSQRTEIVGIQYLRGVCALAVIVDHASSMAASNKYFGWQYFNGLLNFGALGVDIFFVISGFIIATISLRGSTWQPALTTTSFFIKRFDRIVPLMWLAIITHFALRTLIGSSELVPNHYLRALLLFPDGDVEPSVIWTLRHEFLFYCIFAFTFLGKTILRPAIILWFLSPIFFGLIEGTTALPRDDSHFLGIVFSSVNIEFGAGAMLGLFWLRFPRAGDLTLPIHPFLLIFLLVLSSIALVASFPYPWLSVPSALLMGALGATIVWLACRVACPDDFISRFGRLIGDASYSLYLFQLHFLGILLVITSRLLPHGYLALGLIVCCVGTTIGGIAVHLLIERPILRIVKSQLRRRRISDQEKLETPVMDPPIG